VPGTARAIAERSNFGWALKESIRRVNILSPKGVQLMPEWPEWLDIVFRLGAATLIGALMGVYLERRGKPIGVRMLGLVALASAVAVAAAEDDGDGASRAIQGVITGVGFIGAGVIIHVGRDGEAVHGLSTAATIWFTASVGALCGVAKWPLLIVALVLTALLLIAGRVTEKYAGLPDR
jgi:putative Mg2+ transporter-C (MgtC) family protein